MAEILLIPPVTILLYVALVTLLTRAGRMLAGPGQASALKSSTYSSGEAGPTSAAVPGYRQFFLIALFFAILHLGVLILGSGGLTIITGIYLVGLILVLVTLILG